MPFFTDLWSGVVGNLRNCMTTPLTRKNIFIFSGCFFVGVFFITIICMSSTTSRPDPPGSDALKNVPFSIGYVGMEGYLTPHFFINNDTYSKLPKAGLFGVQIFTTSVDCNAQFKDAVSQTTDQLDFIKRLVIGSGSMEIARTTQEILTIRDYGRSGVMLAVGGGHSIDNRLSILRIYFDFGVRVMSLTSMNCNNPWATSIKGNNSLFQDNVYNSSIVSNGTDFLQAVISEMNRLGMLIDIAGSGKQTQSTVIGLSSTPVIFRGVALSNLVSNPMNIDDDIIEKLKMKNGLIMLSLDCSLFAEGTNCSKKDFIDLLNEAKSKLGVKNIGIGGIVNPNGKMPNDLSYNDFPNLFNELKKSGWKMKELEAIAGDNFLTILRKAEEMKNVDINQSFFNISALPPSSRQCYTDI